MIALISTVIMAIIVLLLVLVLPLKISKKKKLMTVGASLVIALLFNLAKNFYSIPIAAIFVLLLVLIFTFLISKSNDEANLDEMAEAQIAIAAEPLELSRNRNEPKNEDVFTGSMNQTKIDEFIRSFTAKQEQEHGEIENDALLLENQDSLADNSFTEVDGNEKDTNFTTPVISQIEIEPYPAEKVQSNLTEWDIPDKEVEKEEEEQTYHAVTTGLPETKIDLNDNMEDIEQDFEIDFAARFENIASNKNEIEEVGLVDELDELVETSPPKEIFESEEFTEEFETIEEPQLLLSDIEITDSEFKEKEPKDVSPSVETEQLLFDIVIPPERDENVEDVLEKQPSQFAHLLADIGDSVIEEDHSHSGQKNSSTSEQPTTRTKETIQLAQNDEEIEESKIGKTSENEQQQKDEIAEKVIFDQRKALFAQLEDDLFK